MSPVSVTVSVSVDVNGCVIAGVGVAQRGTPGLILGEADPRLGHDESVDVVPNEPHANVYVDAHATAYAYADAYDGGE